ncbi:MAG: hypothetical protein JWQ96_3089 [Segetibacter sp.]|nr:hypothetical protein [Segetibacter sp.]
MVKSIRYIYLGYGLSIVVILVISLFFASDFKSLTDYNKKVETTYEVINQLQQIHSSLVESENSVRGYLLFKHEDDLVNLGERLNSIKGEMARLKLISENDENIKAAVIKLNAAAASRFSTLITTHEKALTGDTRNIMSSIERGTKQMSDFRNLIVNFQQQELYKLSENETIKDSFQKKTSHYLILILVVSCIFQVISFGFILKEFKKRHQYQKQLEKSIAELKIINTEHEQIAFVASHDLQEPLRKIRTFTSRLIKEYAPALNEEGQLTVSRINSAAERMQGLIEDLVNYTNLTKTVEEIQLVDLAECVNDVLKSLTESIEDKQAQVKLEDLPTLHGYYKQLHLLLSSIIENALKFSKPNIVPIIKISAEDVRGDTIDKNDVSLKDKAFHRISISDNGIGFDNEFTDKVFIIFQRLHTQNSSYAGKGIGLAISKRVMLNHNGYISAEAQPGVGATFKLYFPRR